MEKWGPFSFNWYLGPGFIPGLAGRTGEYHKQFYDPEA